MAIDGDQNVLLVSDRYGGNIWIVKSCRQERPDLLGACAIRKIRGLAISATGTIYVAGSDHRIYTLDAQLTPPAHLRRPRVPPTVAEDIAGLFLLVDFADVTFTVGGAQVPAHRAVLAARSEYFRAMFRFDACSSAICIKGTTATAFRAVLQYLYTGTMSLTDELVVDAMQLSHQYDILGAYYECVRYCQQRVTVHSAVRWLVALDWPGAEACRARVLLFVRHHYDEVRTLGGDTAKRYLSDHFPHMRPAKRRCT